MKNILVKGPQKLQGSVKVSGAKNAALPIIAASLLTEKVVKLNNVPNLSDTQAMLDILESLGAKIKRYENTLEIKCDYISESKVGYELAERLRASVLYCGSLLGRFNKSSVSLPGGCAIGSRPIDQHINGFKALGAVVKISEGNINLDGELVGTDYHFSVKTVTGSANVIFAAVLASGRTTLTNVALEPEITDLCNFLIAIGAKIEGVGTGRLIIDGVKSLRGGEYSIMQDRIEAGTFLVGALITDGKVSISDFDFESNEPLLNKLRECGSVLAKEGNSITVSRGDYMVPVDIVTGEHPGFPTDLQAQFMVLNIILAGHSTIEEKIFENRFMHAAELSRMGAKIKVVGNIAHIDGGEHLLGTTVSSSDLRASIALILAGLAAKGETRVTNLHHLYRGYEKPVEKFAKLGVILEQEDI